ncbi:hypothetical protein T552_01522 [Pneumocystis carinii B80]|uniref:Uncharacterized protein n=1 Tax=Pneumocystis carinii (strain B80) TaxID=1408658 RepID=A0A0W4ZKJ5_PNEC8|nr:hypothetical protein T552_01522 [Pneumocystis carinii B80]KTW28893.1 hypothetical protein T552_01522 [Pneumocystis carinii B80]
MYPRGYTDSIWKDNDFTEYFKYKYIIWISPICLIISLLILLSTGLYVIVLRYYKKSKRYVSLAQDNDSSNFLSTSFMDICFSRKSTSFLHCGLDELNRQNLKEYKIKPSKQMSVIITEGIIVLFIILLYYFFLDESKYPLFIINRIFTWVYVFILIAIRAASIDVESIPLSTLWYHTSLLYAFHLPLFYIDLRSMIIAHEATILIMLSSINMVLVFVLNAIVLLSRKGNRTVRLIALNGLNPSKEKLSSILSMFTFSWIDPIIIQGFRKSLTFSDIWDLTEGEHSAAVLDAFYTTKKASHLKYTLVRHFKATITAQFVWGTLFTIMSFAPVIFLKLILEYIDNPKNQTKEAVWMYVIGMFFSSVISTFFMSQSYYVGRKLCIKIRSVLVGEIYSKALRRHNNSRSLTSNDDTIDSFQATIGTIINLVAVDAYKISEVYAYLHNLFITVPLHLIVSFILISRIFGWSAIIGFSVIIIFIPINSYFSALYHKIQKEIMSISDTRINLINEIFQNIRLIKYFAWEENVTQNVNSIREEEIKKLWKKYILLSFALLCWNASSVIASLITFLVYTKIAHNKLTAPIAFTSLALFSSFRAPLEQLSEIVSNFMDSKVSINRIDAFLKEEEIERHSRDADYLLPDDFIIGFKNASFTWASKNDVLENTEIYLNSFRIYDLNISFPVDKLTVIIGPVGSGKTSLLMALLGEMTNLGGKEFCPGKYNKNYLIPDHQTGFTESVAYCAQQPWLLSDTIRNNILFYSSYDSQKYNKIVKACALERDFQILDGGDQTEVGEKGIILSGGQKQRISIARAFYSNAKYIILDDCLSSVDSYTAKWIFNYCIKGELSNGRTIIMTTHNENLCVPDADFVIIMDNGRVSAQGTPNDLFESKLLDRCESSLKTVPSSTSLIHSIHSSQISLKEQEFGLYEEKSETNEYDIKDTKAFDTFDSSKGRLIEEEGYLSTSMNKNIYIEYTKYFGGKFFLFVLFLSFIIPPILNVCQSLWVRKWTQDKSIRFSYYSRDFQKDQLNEKNNIFYTIYYFFITTFKRFSHMSTNHAHQTKYQNSSLNLNYYINIYILISLLYIFSTFFRIIMAFTGGIRVSIKLHEKLFQSVLGAKIRFFDATPIGRIMKRFSNDIGVVDQEVSYISLTLVYDFFNSICLILIITYIIPSFLVSEIFIMIIYVAIALFYIRPSRRLKDLDSITKSPIYQHFRETLTGINTIRAYGYEKIFIRENLQKLDLNNRPFIYLWVCNRWLSVRIDFIGGLISLFAGIFIILNIDSLDSGLAGIILFYIVSFTDHMLWLVRLYTINELNFNNVERIREFFFIEQEASAIIPSNRPGKDWPEKGEIVVQNIVVQYMPELQPAISNLSFKVDPCSKVGIVGRTGAGKSTIATAFFRLIELQSGSIIIDGVNISTIGLRDLRRSLTIIPQDPVLFKKSLRYNLDPFNIFTDAEIFEALRRVHLIGSKSMEEESKNSNTNIFLDLNTQIEEGGNNLSHGQRQLICLARSLLKSSRIIIMDECTASIDYNMDTKIQKTIRSEFSCCTILTIAHRLKSIIDYDKILVLDSGKLLEYDHPYLLLQNPQSEFRFMCESSGEYNTLRQLAQEAYESKCI